MTNKYLELKRKQEKEFNEFPMVFAFSDSQFKEGMEKLGLNENDTDKVYKFGNSGGFYRKTDAETLHEMGIRHAKEMQESIESDETGEGFIFDMFSYELANHEYSYTGELDSTLYALDFTHEEVTKTVNLSNGLKKARKSVMEGSD